MELMDLLRRRRACRRFLPDPVPRELLERVVLAAKRAPTASNVPYRHLMVVEDPSVLHAVRQVNPALQANAPCLLLILSDVAMATARVGPVGERTTAVDSGAAAENAWLQAIELGLASQFTMVTTMPGIATVLGLPDHLRVEVVMPLGYADATATAARGARRAPTPVHYDQFGDELH